MQKKYFGSYALVALGLVIALLAAACGNAEPTATSAPPTATTAPTATTPPTVAAPTATTAGPAATATATRPAPTATPIPATATATPVKPKRGGTLRTEQTRNIDGQLDFHATRNSSTWVDEVPLMNWLIANRQAGGGIVPDLAENWDVSTDGLTYTFHMVKNATWSDGKPVTADDVIFSFDRIAGKLDLKVPAYKTTLAAVDSYTKLDAYNVQFKLKAPSASFLANVGIIGNMMYPKHVPISQFAAFQPVGSGPFVWVSYQPDIKVEVKRNPNYWKKDQFGDSLPYLDGITMFVIPDDAARRAAFYTGQLDYSFPHASPFPGHIAELTKNIPGVKVITYYSSQDIYLRSLPPFTNQKLRTALSLALDRKDASQIWFAGESKELALYSIPGGAFALPNDQLSQLPGFRQPKDQDIAQAKQLLADALKEENLSVDKWNPTIKTRVIYQDFAIIAANQWKRNLGITVNVLPQDNPSNQAAILSGNFDMLSSGLGPAYDDPSQELDANFRTGGGLNYGQFGDPAIDAALDQIERTLDPKQRLDLSRALEAKIYNLGWTLPVVGDPRPIAVRPEVLNYSILFNQDNYPNRHEQTWLNK